MTATPDAEPKHGKLSIPEKSISYEEQREALAMSRNCAARFSRGRCVPPGVDNTGPGHGHQCAQSLQPSLHLCWNHAEHQDFAWSSSERNRGGLPEVQAI